MAHIPLSNGKLPQTQPFPARKVRQRMRAGCVVARTVACCVRPVAPRGGGISSWRRLSSLPAYGMACRYYPALFRPFRACAISRSGPTALPWAILFRPVGASGGTVNRPRLAVVFFLPLYTSKLCLNVPPYIGCRRLPTPASSGTEQRNRLHAAKHLLHLTGQAGKFSALIDRDCRKSTTDDW